MPDLSGMSDEMLQAQINMMKSNPDMIKNMMRAQGMNMDDSQLEMITNMMTPEMMKYAQNMQKSGMVPPGGFGNTTNTQNPVSSANAGNTSHRSSAAGAGGPSLVDNRNGTELSLAGLELKRHAHALLPSR